MNWNTTKLNSLIQERTAEAEPLFYPQEPSGDFGNLSLEELKLSQTIHTLDSTGVVGRIKQSFQNLVACLPDVSVVDSSQIRQAEAYIQDKEQFDTDLEEWRERHPRIDLDLNGKKFPLLSAVVYDNNTQLVISNDTGEAPRLYDPNTGYVEQGHYNMNHYTQPTNEQILDLCEAIESDNVRSAVARRVSSHDLANLDQALQEEQTEDEGADEQEAVPSETQSTVSVSADSGASSPSSSDPMRGGEPSDVGDRPGRQWSV